MALSVMCKAEDDSSNLNMSSKHKNQASRETGEFKYEHLIKTSDTNMGSGCPNTILQGIAESRKRNKYRMLGTDLKRKAVHLVS